MALPTFVAAGSTSASINALTGVPVPAGHQSGDLMLLVVQTSAQAPGNNPPSGWTEVPTVSPQSTGVAATAGSVRLSVFYKIAASNNEPNVDIGDSGDHQVAEITVWRGVDTAAPFDVTAGATAASSTAMSCPTVTTTGADRLIVLLFGHAVDSTTSPVSGFTNAALANITNRKGASSSVGTGGGFTVVSGEKTAAGAVGATTATLSTASAQALLTLALKPPTAGTAPFGGFYVATGVKSTAGATGTSTGTLANSQVQTMVAVAFKPPTPVTNNPPTLDSAVPDLFVLAQDDLEFQVFATDPESGVIAWSLVPGSTAVPNGLTIDSLGFIRWTPKIIDQGVYNVKVRATDVGGLFVEQAFNVTVTGGFASAVEVANRAQVDLDSAHTLVNLLDQQEQMNANVIRKARELRDELQATLDYMAQIIADQT